MLKLGVIPMGLSTGSFADDHWRSPRRLPGIPLSSPRFFAIFLLAFLSFPSSPIQRISAQGLVVGTPVQQIVARLGDSSCLDREKLREALTKAAVR